MARAITLQFQLNKLESKLKEKHFPNLGLGNFWDWKEKELEKKKRMLTNSFSLNLELELDLQMETRAWEF